MTLNSAAINFRETAEFGADFGQLPMGSKGGAQRLLAGSDAPRAPVGLTLELVTSRAQFDALEDEWNELHGRVAPVSNPFLSFNWCWHWCNHFLGQGSGTQLTILTGRRFGRLVMIWPMVQQRVGSMTSLTWLGAPVSQYGDVLAEAGEGRATLLELGWAYLRREVSADFIALGKVRSDGTVAPLLNQLGLQITRRDAAPFVDLGRAPTYDAYAEKFSSSHRRRRRRSQRGLETRGEVGYIFQYEGNEARSLSQHILALKRRWLKDRGIVSSGLSDSRTAGFFGDVADGLGRPTGCRVLALRCGDDIVAGEISFAHNDSVSGHVMAFNVDYERQSPGMFITEDNLRLCKDFGYTRFDFMGPSEQHKLEWADGVVELNDYAMALSLSGALWVNGYLGWGRPRLKKLVNAVPQGARAFIAKLHPALERLA